MIILHLLENDYSKFQKIYLTQYDLPLKTIFSLVQKVYKFSFTETHMYAFKPNSSLFKV